MTASSLPFGALAAALLCASSLAAQHSVGWRDLILADPQSETAQDLHCRVVYPADTRGDSIAKRPGGWPTVVFLHGWDSIGRDYQEHGLRWAELGWIVVQLDTPRRDAKRLIDAGHATFAVLRAENVRRRSLLFGAIDERRVVLAGHSVGGAAVIRVLANNPGYRAGAAYAPWVGRDDETLHLAGKVRVPMIVVAGLGDEIASAHAHAKPCYDRLSTQCILKALVVFDKHARHYNLVAWAAIGRRRDHQVFESAQQTVNAFLRAAIDETPARLDRAVGVRCRRAPHVAHVEAAVERPLYFAAGSTRIGEIATLQALAEPGPALHLFSFSTARVPSPWGSFGLDPQTVAVLGQSFSRSNFSVLPVPLPFDERLRGRRLWFQALVRFDETWRMSNVTSLRVGG